MKLYTHPPSPNCIKVMAVANYLGIPLEQVSMDPPECKQPEYLAHNPNGKVPTLEDGGYFLWESHAIMVYLAQSVAEQSLHPTDARGQAELWRWMSWSMCHWGPALHTFLYQRMVRPMILNQPPDPQVLEQAEKSYHPLAAILDAHVQEHSFVLGEQLTLADFSLAANLVYAAMARIPLADYPSLRAWYDRISALPAWQEAIPAMIPPEIKAR